MPRGIDLVEKKIVSPATVKQNAKNCPDKNGGDVRCKVDNNYPVWAGILTARGHCRMDSRIVTPHSPMRPKPRI